MSCPAVPHSPSTGAALYCSSAAGSALQAYCGLLRFAAAVVPPVPDVPSVAVSACTMHMVYTLRHV